MCFDLGHVNIYLLQLQSQVQSLSGNVNLLCSVGTGLRPHDACIEIAFQTTAHKKLYCY